MIWFSSAATHDHMLLEKLRPNANTIYVFDKGYNDYKAFQFLSESKGLLQPTPRSLPFKR